MNDDWWHNPATVTAFVEWMRNDGYFALTCDEAAETPWLWSWEYKRFRDDTDGSN